MEIQKLKKKLLREELRRRRKNSKKHRLLVHGLLLGLILVFGGLIFYNFNFDRRMEETFAEAEALVEAGSYEEAASVFRRIYDRHPGFHLAPQALFQSAEVENLFLRRYQEALVGYLMVEKDYPDTNLCRKAQVQIAEIYKNRLRDYSQAIIAYQKLLDQGEEEGDRIQYEIGDCYFRLENYEQARIEFESLLKNFPKSPLVPEVHYRIAVSWFLEGAPVKSEEAFRTVIEQWPDSPYALEARFSLAEVLEQQEDLQGALKILTGLQGGYGNTEALEKRIDQVKARLVKKKKGY